MKIRSFNTSVRYTACAEWKANHTCATNTFLAHHKGIFRECKTHFMGLVHLAKLHVMFLYQKLDSLNKQALLQIKLLRIRKQNGQAQ